MLRTSLRILFGGTKLRTYAIPTDQRKNTRRNLLPGARHSNSWFRGKGHIQATSSKRIRGNRFPSEGSERIDMTKFGGKWHRVDLVEHWDREPHSADANVVETLDLVNAACTAWLAKKALLLSWESTSATNRSKGRSSHHRHDRTLPREA
jgi:hypothetical protein